MGFFYLYFVVRCGFFNVLFLLLNKWKRVDVFLGLDGFYVVFSNNDYIMYNFKIQKIFSGLDNLWKCFKVFVLVFGLLREN